MFTKSAQDELTSGFTSDDAFDAMMGAIHLALAFLGKDDIPEPPTPELRTWEGWVFGRPAV